MKKKIKMNNIIKGNTRILRPFEITKLIRAIPKISNKEKFEVLLYSGARYTELQNLHKHPNWLVDNTIRMKSTKPKAKQSERYIRLNPQGVRAVEYFLRGDNLPHYVSWDHNLKRWAKLAGIGSEGICIKSTRKTWESWLVTSYPKQLEYVFLSQGHSQMTALKFYLMIPFSEEDKREMITYTMSWI